MGTETHYPIGTILKRRKLEDNVLDELRVVGGGNQLVVTSNLAFESSFELDGHIALSEYEEVVPEGGTPFNPRAIVGRKLSPEEIFSEHARTHPEEAVTGRQPRGGRRKKETAIAPVVAE